MREGGTIFIAVYADDFRQQPQNPLVAGGAGGGRICACVMRYGSAIDNAVGRQGGCGAGGAGRAGLEFAGKSVSHANATQSAELSSRI